MAEFLHKGEVFQIDEEFRWFLEQVNLYVRTSKPSGKKYVTVTVPLHRLLGLLEGITIAGSEVDHINGDSMDNQLHNLRVCTTLQNQANKQKRSGTKCRYKGVQPSSNGNGRFSAHITREGKHYNLGTYRTEIEAASAYNRAARELFGEFACLNDIKEVTPIRTVRGIGQGKSSKATSKYRGVWWDRAKKKWAVAIELGEKRKFIGRYSTELEAAVAYNRAAAELHGDLAILNEVQNA